jgi:RND family efflux transporter MFP subunit
MKRLLCLSLLALSACGDTAPDTADSQPSVLVTTTRVARGSLPETIPAYGTAGPALSGVQTISFNQPGQVTALLVTPGLAVRAGQPLLVFAPSAGARGAYAQARNALRAAQAQKAANAQLLAQQLATTDQMAQAQRALADAQAGVAALSAEGADAASHMVTAPFDGIVATIPVAQGDRTQPGAALLTLARAGALVASAGIDPADRAAVTPGQGATLQRLAGGPPLHGRVLRVGAALDPRTRLVDVDVAFPAGALMPGEAVRIAIATHAVTGWVVPHAAVVTADGPPHVFQDKGVTARQVPVTVLLAGDQNDVVEGPIDGNQPLVVEGAYQLRDGDRLRRGQ